MYLREGQDSLDLWLWDLERREAIFKTSGIAGRCFAFSPDGRSLALAQHDGPILVYDLGSMECIHRLDQAQLPYSLAFSPDGRQLAVSSTENHLVQVRDVGTGVVLQSLLHSNSVFGMAWHPSGSHLAAGCKDRNVYLWDMTAGSLHALLPGHQASVMNVAFNHRGDMLLTCAYDGDTRLWDPLNARPTLTKTGGFASFSLDDSRLGFLPERLKLGVLEVASGVECRRLYLDVKRAENSWSCEFSPDGRCLLTANKDGAHLWDWSAGTEMSLLPEKALACARFVRGGSLITAGEGGLKKWTVKPPVEQGAPWNFGVETLFGNRQVPIKNFSLSADGAEVCVEYGRRLFVFDTESADMKMELGGDVGVYRAAFSPDGKWAAAASYDHSLVRIWDAHTGSVIRDLPGQGANYLAFSPGGEWLVISSEADYRCLDTPTWQCAHILPRSAAGGSNGRVAFSPNGQMMAVTYSAQVVRLVDTASGKEQATFEMPEPQVILDLAFNPDGSQLAVCGATPVIYVWNLRLIREQLAAMKLDW
jgi:WD40 repeat protein